jgi:hypothetical protein
MTALDTVTDRQRSIASSIAFGVLGAGLVFIGRRTKPGIVATIATTAGYTLLTRGIGAVVSAVLEPAEA